MASDAREAIQTQMAILGNTDEVEETSVIFQKTKMNYRRTNLFSRRASSLCSIVGIAS